MKTLIIYPNMPQQFSLPHSVGRISSALKLRGDDVKLFDTTLYPSKTKTDEEKRIERGQLKPYNIRGLKDTDMIEDFNKTLEDFNPDNLMITFVDNTIDIGMNLLESASKDIYTIAGGVSVILNPERFKKSPLIDEVWTGTIEDKLFPNASDLELKDDWTIFDEERLYRPMSGEYVKSIPLLTSTGCPFNCGFCCAPSLRKCISPKKKTVEGVIEELEFQNKTHKPEFFYFSSETFLDMPKRNLKKFAEAYKKLDIPFWCQTHINTIDEERAKLLSDMNCHKVSIGIESGDEEYRRGMIKKKFSNERAVEAFRILKKYDISAASNNIIGLPLETEEQIKETIELNKKIYNVMEDVQLNCYIYQPYHGTTLRNFCEKNDLLKEEEPNTVIGDPVIKNPYISDEKLMYYVNNFQDLVRGEKIIW